MKNQNNKNILILGGCGFIGTNLTLKLIDQNVNIYLYDIDNSKIIKQLKNGKKVK